MPRTVKTEAIVLRKRSLLNKDVLVSLFSQAEGKITVIAKGVKKLTSRRAPHLETFNLIEVELHQSGERLYLEGTALLSGFSELKKNQEKLAALYQYFFILERLLPENQKEDIIYNLTKSFLIQLYKSTSEYNILEQYLNRLLRGLGYTKADHDMAELEGIISDLINEKLPEFHI